ncbi:MAG TPA: hypothetical protein VKV21_14340 [Solirubrobacteraceae bacterium]|nr:hypothetical protein [Solirubrobacteraceae bacterium]
MHLVFDIFQGLGVAAAIGVRPFLPSLVAGVLAAGDVELTFHHTRVHFLQQPVFLFAMVVGILLLALAERRLARGGAAARPVMIGLAACAVVLGALFGAGTFAHYHHGVHHLLWIGGAVGIVCALIGVAATQPLLTRVRSRLDAEAGGVLPFVSDGVAALAAALSVLAPPIGVIVLLALLWLLIAGRGRADRKYAGLRILR